MLALAVALLGLSLPLDHWRAHQRSRLPATPKPRPGRRASLAEHAWEEHVLYNLTRSDPSWE